MRKVGILLESNVYPVYRSPYTLGGHCGRDLMIVGFTTTCAISAYHH
jgi:hypothetical protein